MPAGEGVEMLGERITTSSTIATTDPSRAGTSGTPEAALWAWADDRPPGR